MNRSPRPLSSRPPAPRSPSSSSAPVMRELGTMRPVGWNWTISMSRTRRPARTPRAMPSDDLSAEQATTRYMLGEPVHELEAGEVALVDGAVVALAGERLLVDAAVGMAVEEAAVARLELEHAAGRLAD